MEESRASHNHSEAIRITLYHKRTTCSCVVSVVAHRKLLHRLGQQRWFRLFVLLQRKWTCEECWRHAEENTNGNCMPILAQACFRRTILEQMWSLCRKQNRKKCNYSIIAVGNWSYFIMSAKANGPYHTIATSTGLLTSLAIASLPRNFLLCMSMAIETKWKRRRRRRSKTDQKFIQ